MAPGTSKKRSHHDSAAKAKLSRPSKKQKQSLQNDSEEEQSSFNPVNLLDSDDEGGLDAVVENGDSSDDSGSQSDASASEDDSPAREKLGKPKAKRLGVAKRKLAQDAPPSSDEEEQDDEEDEDDDDDSGLEGDEFDIGDDEEEAGAGGKKAKSKRNDPTAFATSLQKILGTKLSTSRRVDPVLSRSVEAQKASREIIDAALEAKAKKQMRAQKLAAQEKGRVKDIITGPRNASTGELEATTQEIREKEKQLRRAATRGVKEVFNAFLRAQQAGMEAESQARKDGFTGVEGRKEKVSEMSRKGFLDLIANGGGKLKKGGIEEA